MAQDGIESLDGTVVVVKFGGNAMVDASLADAFCSDILALQRAGARVALSHGGGPQISSELISRGIHSEFRGGLRVTTPEAVGVVGEVLARIGAELADRLVSAGGRARPLAGAEHGLFTARRRGTTVEGEHQDLGHVGEIVTVDSAPVLSALEAGSIPVVSAIARQAHTGELLNVNADSAAAALAAALGAQWLLLLTDVAGLYLDWPDRRSLVRTIDTDEVEALLPRLESGMIPKAAAARDALRGGVGRVALIDGRIPHVLVSEPFGASGTVVTRGRGMAL